MHIALTGHRPSVLGWGYDLNTSNWLKLKVILRTLLYDTLKTYPHLTIHVGGALGADTVWADVAYELRDQYQKPIRVHIHIPGEWQASKWTLESIGTWQKHRDLADEVTVYCPIDQPYNGKWLHARNRSMIKQADIIVALWNGQNVGGTASALNDARVLNKPIFNINPHILETYTQTQMLKLQATPIITPERIRRDARNESM